MGSREKKRKKTTQVSKIIRGKRSSKIKNTQSEKL